MKSFLSLLFICTMLFISCKKELEPQDSTSSSKIVPFTEAAKPLHNQTTMPSPTSQSQNTINQTNTITTPTTVSKGINPAHGQPGHRCDIVVGAPLNSPVTTPKSTPTTAATQQSNSIPTTIASPNPTTTTATTSTPEGINPPHGQDKHRCDIAVGAPLPKE